MFKPKLITGFLVVILVAAGVYFRLLSEGEEKFYWVGILTAGAFSSWIDGSKAGMTELGYIESENIVHNSHYVEADFTKMKRIVKEIVARKADSIFIPLH